MKYEHGEILNGIEKWLIRAGTQRRGSSLGLRNTCVIVGGLTKQGGFRHGQHGKKECWSRLEAFYERYVLGGEPLETLAAYVAARAAENIRKAAKAAAPKPPKTYKKSAKGYKAFNAFYLSKPWRKLRYQALLKYGRKCQCCESLNGPFHVDHIKPRSKYPELELVLENLQVMCEDCNMGKGGWDETDWREKEELDELQEPDHLTAAFKATIN